MENVIEFEMKNLVNVPTNPFYKDQTQGGMFIQQSQVAGSCHIPVI